MTDHEAGTLPDRWSGEFESDPLDSLQEEHHSAVADEQLVLVPGPPSGSTEPYEDLLTDLPEEEEAIALPQPERVSAKLSKFIVREWYDEPVALPSLSAEEEEADGGFAMTKESVDEYEIPVPGFAPPQPPARHRRSSFALPDDEPLAFPDSQEDGEELIDLGKDWGADPEAFGIERKLRKFQVETTFSTEDDDLKAMWDIPAQVEAIVGEGEEKGLPVSEVMARLDELAADVKALAQRRSPHAPYTDEDFAQIDRVIRESIPESTPVALRVTAVEPLPTGEPAQPTPPPATPAPQPWDSKQLDKAIKRAKRLPSSGDSNRKRKLPVVRLLIVVALFYFLDWPDALAIVLFFGALWAVWTVLGATARWSKDAYLNANYTVRSRIHRYTKD